MKNEFIYALTHWVNGRKIYFYVGRSEREVGIRYKEHRNAVHCYAPRFNTDVYNYIRANDPLMLFEEELLCWCEDDNVDDYEDYWVIKLIRDGHNLQNEKHGDAKRLALLEDAYELERDNVRISTVKDYRLYKEKRAFERAAALREKVLAEEQNSKLHLNPTMLAFFEESSALIAAARVTSTAKAAKKRAMDAVRAEAMAVWLREQQRLFELEQKSVV